ncbi:LysR family transcriptional regulator [Romboutsia sedimentorum]|uniref:LysR family transcriptional regulator n=1 Tax=Romboutsia sedimentorum TaxID=1368474 RepID=UPI0024DDFC26|nr:LysR family transcriptional regulator [Romboutsia sedimentorum]MDK2587138.1 LysR family transcriptional regulator [Romboutsia sedimentorum]
MFEELKTFIAVVEFKNFTKAGEHLNLSQPSVSTHIKNLESVFGVRLINRSVKQKTIVITESGFILYKKAKEILNLIDITHMEVLNTSNSLKGHLKIGASLTIGEYVLPKFLAIFCKKYPDIDIEVFIENTSIICSHLKELTLDIGLIEGTSSSSSFTQEYFLEDKMVLAFPYNSELITDNFSFDKLQNQKWVVREEGSGTREFLNMFLGTNEIVPNGIMVLGSNYAVKEAVRNNLGITIISNFVALPGVENKELSIIELNNPYVRHFSYILPKNITISKVSQVFLEEFKEYTSTL